MPNAIVNQNALDGRVNDMKIILGKLKPQLRSMLPAHYPPQKMVQHAINAIQANPRLLDADPRSFILALLHCATYGLEPNTPMHEASLIPYNVSYKDANGKWCKKMIVQVIAEYYGYIKLGMNTGLYASIEARAVYENEEFEVDYGKDNPLTHKLNIRGNRGDLIAAYCRVTFKDKNMRDYIEVMTAEDIEIVQKSSPTGKDVTKYPDSPWAKHPDQMWRKSPIRRAFKYLPKSPELARFIAEDDKAVIGEQQQFDEELTKLLYEGEEIPANAEVEKTSRTEEIVKDLNVKSDEKKEPESKTETVPPKKESEDKTEGTKQKVPKPKKMNKDERITIAMLLNNKSLDSKKGKDLKKLAVDMLKSKETTHDESEDIIGQLDDLPNKGEEKTESTAPAEQQSLV